MQYIDCKAEGAKATLTADPPAMATGFAGVFAVRCEFDQVWDGLPERVCSFRAAGLAPTDVLGDDGSFTVPVEVNTRPWFDFALSGTAADGRRITTNAVRVEVALSVPRGDEAGDPTPSVSAQALEVAERAAADSADALISVADLTARVGELELTGGVAPATRDRLGTVKVGEGITVADDGTIAVEAYDGTVTVTPKVSASTVLGTAGKVVRSDIEVGEIPVYRVSNDEGGVTVIIGDDA